MHQDRNNRSWSDLKGRKNHDEFDGKASKATNFLKDDVIESAHDSRKERNDRATQQLEGVKNMFKSMADYDYKQNEPFKK